MAKIKLQGEKEKQVGIYYEFDTSSKLLGEGGMGKVYRGKRINVHTHETREVAIKFLYSGLPQNVIQRAENEANIRIMHDNLVEMMGFLSVETRMADGMVSVRHHVVSELLMGVSLSDLLQGILTDRDGNIVPFAQMLYNMYNNDPEQFAVTVTKKILSGIMALHDAGYIHRDIDPSNIMITRDGKIKLIDFGIAKQVDGLKPHDRNLTTAGQFMGKPQYAAPELIIGDIKNQNKPTDIYAIGVLLFQLTTGHLPFEGPANVVLNAHLRSDMPLKQIRNPRLRRIIAKATEKDCTKRYQSAALFRAELDSLAGTDNTTYIFGMTLAKFAAVAGTVVVSITLLVCMAVFIPKLISSGKDKTDEEQTIVQKETEKEATPSINEMPAIRRQMLNPSEAKEGFANLTAEAESGDIEALFVMSRLYAISSGSFTLGDEYVTMQANLEGTVSPDPAKAHKILTQIAETKPNYYPALYELACNYYEGPNLTGGEARNLRYAKDLLDKAYKYASEAEDPVYVNKISALLRKY